MSARSFCISQLVALCILVPGGLLFRDSELGSFAVLAMAFGVGLPLFHALEERESRRKRSGS